MDPISDFLIRIQNGYRAKKPSVVVPFSKVKAEIARVLAERNYLGGTEKKGRKVRKFLELTLCYENKQAVLEGVKRISHPSRRIYVQAREIKPIRQGFGMQIISTSKGMMSGEDARKNKLGGEVIAEVW